MFTGLVEATGEVLAIEREGDARLTLSAPFAAELAIGDSVAVNGVCLTAVEIDPAAPSFTADVMPETLAASTLGGAHVGTRVNLERALATGDRLGGHIVAGHVDAVTTLLSRTPGPRWDVLRFELPDAIAPLVAHKGSIALNGVSLTISAVSDPAADEPFFEVSLIPQTLAETNLGILEVGDLINVETDTLARYVQRQLDCAVPCCQDPDCQG